MQYRIRPSHLQGNITIPASKSHTLRAILFANMAHGRSVIRHYLPSPDTQAMLRACEALGARIEATEEQLTIVGVNGKPSTPVHSIDAGNSGQVLRFVAAVAALSSGYTMLSGDESIRTLRPIQPLLDGLTRLGVFAESALGNGLAPVIVRGPLQGGHTHLDGADSQPVSALLIAAAFASQPTVIEVSNPGEKPWIDLTLDWLRRLGIVYQREDYSRYTVSGNAAYPGFEYTVPGDFSSCAFPLVAALVTGSHLILDNLDMQDVQGDKELVTILQEMGAKIVIDAGKRALQVYPSPALVGKSLDVNQYIDALPILAVLACFASGETTLTGAAIARQKESDRISAMTQGLRAMGADIDELEDGLRIRPAPLTGTLVSSFSDHRIAMALAIAGLAAHGETLIDHTNCVAKSYPDFLTAMQQLGANIESIP
jgi:3-phosphoshikimate 1-carboxyvinyltransferase